MKKETNNSKDKNTMTTREVAALVEDFQSQFRAFGEGLSALREKTEGIANALASMMERITMIELRLKSLENKR